MQAHALAGIAPRRTGNRENPGKTHSGQFFGQIGLRLDQHAPPAEPFEVPGLDSCCGRLAPTSTKKPDYAPEKRPHELLLASVGRSLVAMLRRTAAYSIARRDLCTILVVLKPGTRSMRITSPPSLLDQRVAHDLLAPVVAAFHQDLWTHAADQFERRVLIEYDDEIYRLDRRQHLGARM